MSTTGMGSGRSGRAANTVIALLAGCALSAQDAIPAPTLDSLLAADPKGGFVLLAFNGRTVDEVPLTQRTRTGNRLRVASASRPGPAFTFTIRESRRHLALTLTGIEGDVSDRATGLCFRVNTPTGALTAPIDHLVTDVSNERRIDVRWPWLWNGDAGESKGAFAIAARGSDADNDRALAEIWSEEPLPHPAIGRPWTEAEVHAWIERYHDTFVGLNRVNLSAEDPQQLTTLTATLHSMGVRRVYLHTDAWRYDYWPVTRSFTAVNPRVFPGGREDLVRYSLGLHAQGMQLQLHNVSGGIGRRDPEFITPSGVDPRLETWFHGTLVADLAASARELRVRPDPGVSCPHARLGAYWNLRTFAIAGEILRISDILDSDTPVWRLVIERHGHDGTAATDHPAGTPVAGLMNAYGQNYVPDPQSDLLTVQAERYATLINEARLDHQHYDGAEIHCGLSPWGFSKFSALVAARVDHPTTSSTSGGRMSPWTFEQRFSRIASLAEIGYWDIHLPLQLADHRNASSWLDAHFEANSKILSGARRVSMGKTEPMFGLGCESVAKHGLFPRLQGLFASWARILPHLDPRDAAYIGTFLTRVSSPLSQAGSHSQGRDVLVLEDRPAGPVLVPTRILAREGRDAPWLVGQEFGATAPRQYVQPGTPLTLTNPYPAQTPGLVIHVLPAASDTASAAGSAPEADAARSAQLANYRTGTELPTRQGEPATPVKATSEDWWPTADGSAGLTTLTATREALTLRGTNPSDRPYWTERDLPAWSINLPLRNRRAVQMTIDGDGSGAVLVLQLDSAGTRDYVVPITFTGRRTITIANGEVAWADAAWGWRFEAKSFDYNGRARRARLGFGHLPPHATATVTITALSIPEALPTALVDPVFRCGHGSLAVQGTVACDEYLTYEAAEGARVFDRNWNLLRTLPATATAFSAGPVVDFQVDHAGTDPQPWLEVQVLTRGEAHPLATRP